MKFFDGINRLFVSTDNSHMMLHPNRLKNFFTSDAEIISQAFSGEREFEDILMVSNTETNNLIISVEISSKLGVSRDLFSVSTHGPLYNSRYMNTHLFRALEAIDFKTIRAHSTHMVNENVSSLCNTIEETPEMFEIESGYLVVKSNGYRMFSIDFAMKTKHFNMSEVILIEIFLDRFKSKIDSINTNKFFTEIKEVISKSV